MMERDDEHFDIDDDFVAEACALQAGLQLRGGIQRDDGNGERLARDGHL